ncbi:MAG: hypothetical protein AAB495_03055 [Patescibacteria group bacterium]
MSSEIKVCQNCHKDFTIESEDFDFYKKIDVPYPTWCPECRLKRRLRFRNERTFYRRKCDLCRKDMIGMYPPDTEFPVYCVRCWWSDGWDPASYGRDFDFSRPFFDQLQELMNKVPAISSMNDDGVGSVNCEYTYDWAFSKNCYLGACGWYVENGLYMYIVNHAKDIMDAWNVNNSELMYESINCDKCYNCKYCELCFDSNNCVFGFDLRGCSDCVLCVGLRNKRYCILNRQYAKDEYEKELAKLNLGSRAGIEANKKMFSEFSLQFPRRYTHAPKTTNSSGFFLLEAKSAKQCFYCFSPIENSSYIVINDRAKDSYDCIYTGNPELCYESVTPDNSRGNKFTVFCWKCVDAEYSNNCHSCTNVFGSAGLKHASYAILNKKYSKEEFETLRAKIAEHMKRTGEYGEFFPNKLSPFAYNESAALDWFPVSKDEALRHGERWKDDEKKNYAITKKPAELPDLITEVQDDIVNEVIGCSHDGGCGEKCTAAFRIVPAELQLYRRFGVPLPVLCPNCRYYARFKRVNPPRLWKRSCDCGGPQSTSGVYKNTIPHSHGNTSCFAEFKTSYAPGRPEIVYCEGCYNAEVA